MPETATAPQTLPDTVGACRNIGELAHRVGWCSLIGREEPVRHAMNLLDAEPGLPGIVVVDRTATGDRFVALLSRLWLQTTLAKAFARELYIGNPIRRMLDTRKMQSLLLDSKVPVEEAVTRALSRPEAEHFEPLAVHGEDGQFRIVDLRAALLCQRDTLVDTTAQLQAAKAVAESASKAKGTFLANLSHEIRTPMNAILGMTELLAEMATSPRQREYQAIVRQSAESLLRLLNDVLDLSKMEAGKVRLEDAEFSLRDVLIDALRPLSLQAAGKGLELACRFDPKLPETLRGDPGRLGQIITNLAGNAIKFTGSGEVVISVDVKELSLDRAQLDFAVRDTGIGIPLDRQTAIFEAFSQADTSTTRRFGGTGLGLTISAQLVAMMNGRLRVESAPGKGSVFRFRATIDAPFRRPPPEPPDELRGRRVLVVDDNAASRDIVLEALRTWGLSATPAESGDEAIAHLRRTNALGEPFHLAILDAVMPGEDGVALAQRISEDGNYGLPQNRLILLASPGQLDRAAGDAGPAERVYKPLRPADLLQSVVRAMALPGATASPQKRPGPAPAARPLKILLAEDGPVNQKVAIALLARRGHRAIVAENGREAIAAMERERFDVILMDLQMPEMDGLEATRILKRRTDLPRTPIIAMTANAMPGDREQCLAAGMDGYIAKPVRSDELYAVVESLARPATVESSPEEPRPVVREPFDRREALELAGGNEELMRDLAAVFIEHVVRVKAEMEEAFASRNPLKIERAAHTLKGSSSVLAARPAMAAALALERLAREGDLPGAVAAWTCLVIELDLLVPVLAELAAEAPPALERFERNEALDRSR